MGIPHLLRESFKIELSPLDFNTINSIQPYKDKLGIGRTLFYSWRNGSTAPNLIKTMGWVMRGSTCFLFLSIFKKVPLSLFLNLKIIFNLFMEQSW